MKEKKIREALRLAQDAVEQANKALNDVMQELDDDALDGVVGAGNPFADVPRVPTQPIDDDPRGNG